MDLYEAARRVYRAWKGISRRDLPLKMSRVRRIDRVFPPAGTRLVAMTFDDGPTAAPARPYSDQGITSLLLDIMKQYGAKGTFNVIGSTSENYPDRPGRPGSFAWGGIRFDDYPEFGKDSLAGAASQPDLMRHIIREGHEVSNHGYRHLAFGPLRVIYGARAHFSTLGHVIEDLKRLHSLVLHTFGYTMRLARPPHYVDAIPDGHSSYDAYEAMNYQYVGASIDGVGWRASCGDPRDEGRKMTERLERVLKANPDSLNGHIIFENGGYNMSLEAPVVEALPQKLALLQKYGYRVVTVKELMEASPYTDIGPSHPAFSAVRLLETAGVPVLYRDNTFRPEQLCMMSEMTLWLSYAETGHRG